MAEATEADRALHELTAHAVRRLRCANTPSDTAGCSSAAIASTSWSRLHRLPSSSRSRRSGRLCPRHRGQAGALVQAVFARAAAFLGRGSPWASIDSPASRTYGRGAGSAGKVWSGFGGSGDPVTIAPDRRRKITLTTTPSDYGQTPIHSHQFNRLKSSRFRHPLWDSRGIRLCVQGRYRAVQGEDNRGSLSQPPSAGMTRGGAPFATKF